MNLGSQIGWPEIAAQQIAEMRRVKPLALRYPLDPATPQTWADQQWGQRCFTLVSQRLELVSTWGTRGPTGETMKRMFGFKPEWLVWISPEDYEAGVAPWIAQGYVEEEHPYGDAGWYTNMLSRAPHPGWRPVPYCIIGGNAQTGLRLWRQSYLARVDLPAYRTWAAKQVREHARVCLADALFVGVKWAEFENPQLFDATHWPTTVHKNFYAPGAFVTGINAFLRELAAGDPPLLSITTGVGWSGATNVWDWVEPETDFALIAEGGT